MKSINIISKEQEVIKNKKLAASMTRLVVLTLKGTKAFKKVTEISPGRFSVELNIGTIFFDAS